LLYPFDIAGRSSARAAVCRGLREHESLSVTGIDVVLPQQPLVCLIQKLRFTNKNIDPDFAADYVFTNYIQKW
jgi:hypothetical protein